MADRQKLIDGLLNNYVPVEVTESIVKQVLLTEQTLKAAFDAIDKVPNKNAGVSAVYDKARADYQRAYAQHNVFKFWCLLLPPLRARFTVVKTASPTGNQIRPPSLGAIRAASNGGWIPSQADAAKWVAESAAKDTVATLRAEGTFVDGLRGLGAAPAVVLGVAAAAVAVMVVAYYAVAELAATVRDVVTSMTIKDLAEKEKRGEVAPGTTATYTATQAKKEEERIKAAGGGLLGQFSGVLMWIVAGAVVVVLGPTIASSLAAGKAAKRALPQQDDEEERFRKARDVTPKKPALPAMAGVRLPAKKKRTSKKSAKSAA